jgi:hypothetical protein
MLQRRRNTGDMDVSITTIAKALHGERVVALSPGNASEVATDWPRRPNLFPGRALTVATLAQRQRWQAGHIAQRGQAFTSGVTRGLEVGYVIDGVNAAGQAIVTLKISEGHGLAVSGEDVVLAREIECLLSALPVVAPPAAFAGLLNAEAQQALEDTAAQNADPTPGAPRPRAIGPTLGQVMAAAPASLPPVGILLLQPVTVDTSDFDPTDPCDRCPCDDGSSGADPSSFEDWRIADGVRLLWYAWPQEWLALPPGSRLRNELAHLIFDTEGALTHGDALPWENWGVPLAMIGVDAAWRPLFADRAAVVRQGGRARDPRLQRAAPATPAATTSLAANNRLPALWQARIEQFAEQVAAAGEPAPAASVLAQTFSRLPPCGLLPKNAMDLQTLRSEFFPLGFDVDAAPVPVDQLDVALRANAGLAPINLSNAESVRILVPVPQAAWEPRLLLRESVAPEFQQTLDQFQLTRARALGARQGLRNKQAVLIQAISGVAPVVPAFNDDADALEVETLNLWGPPPAGGGHRSSLNAGVHQHYFEGATTTLTALTSDNLYCWVYLDPENPPSTLMLQWHTADWEHRAYWGDNLIVWGQDGAASRRRMGDLPALGAWLRLEVPATNVGINDATINGMAFTLFGGRAAFAATGAIGTTGDAVAREWFGNVLPQGAQKAGDETWDLISHNDLWAPFEPTFSVTPVIPGSVPVGGAQADSPALRIGQVEVLPDLLSDPSLAGLSTHERSRLPLLGLEGFITYLKSRADRADDIVDYGFVKVQTDVYRIRQLMLGTTAASRLTVSPALASIAQADTAVASQQQIASFLGSLKTDAASTQVRAMAVADSAAGASATRPSNALLLDTARIDSSAGRISDFSLNLTTSAKLVEAKTAISPIIKQANATPIEVVNAAPLIGNTFVRTTTITQRLKDPAATEARDYSTRSRQEAVQALLRLADTLIAEDNGVTPGLFSGVELHGLTGDPFLEATKSKRLFADFIDVTKRGPLLENLGKVPRRGANDADEAAHFSDSTDLSDHVVALMRQMEGRVKLYRDAISVCLSVLNGLNKDAAALRAHINVVVAHLAEARHDVGVAKALLAEETDRIHSINERRVRVLAEQVRFLAFVRPRERDNLLSAPRRDLNPGLLEAPVPACLKAHDDIPDDLQDMLRVVRDAPAHWFVTVPRLIDKLDRPELLIKTLQSAQLRSQAKSLLSVTAVAATQSKVGNAIHRVAVQQTALLSTRVEAMQRLNLASLASATWQSVRVQATQLISFGDLIDGAHGRNQLAREAAAEFDRIAHIAACLHAEFSGVLPSIRLDWAETLSEYDAAPNLRNLGSLARWSEIGYIDRRQMQSYVDYLFAQLEPRQPQGEALMNDVVRMCLLLASHAPVDRIIAGRLKQPVTDVRPGVRLPLTVFDASRLRVGMQALMIRGGNVVARATVEDIGNAEVSARVIHTSATQVDLGDDVRVQFSDAAAVSLTSMRTVMTKAALR